MDNAETACCNLVIWDFLIVTVVTGMLLSKYAKWHPVFCILTGILVGAIVFVLMSIKYIGFVVKIFFSVVWTAIILGVIDGFFNISESLQDDIIWLWTIRIIIFLVCFIIHVAGMQEFSEGIDMPLDISMPHKANSNNYILHNTIVNEKKQIDSEELFREYNVVIDENINICKNAQEILSRVSAVSLQKLIDRNCEQMHFFKSRTQECRKILGEEVVDTSSLDCADEVRRYIEIIRKMNQSIADEVNKVVTENMNSLHKTSEIDESLFNGCHSKDDIVKRYRNLMKTFHPDNETGDIEMTQKIQKTYEYVIGRLI